MESYWKFRELKVSFLSNLFGRRHSFLLVRGFKKIGNPGIDSEYQNKKR